jgi:uncharacterized protein DUF4282
MQAKGFFASLFDYSFSSFITSRIVKVLYVLTTIVVALWTLAFVLFAFRLSSAFGLISLLVLGPVFFVITMIYVRVGTELIIAFFRIHEDVAGINQRVGGAEAAPVAPVLSTRDTGLDPAVTATSTVAEPTSEATPVASSSPPEPAPGSQTTARFCENCGVERRPGKNFCIACGVALA